MTNRSGTIFNFIAPDPIHPINNLNSVSYLNLSKPLL